MAVFDWLESSGSAVAGMEQIRTELAQAWADRAPARIRHILNCYVCHKGRELARQGGVLL